MFCLDGKLRKLQILVLQKNRCWLWDSEEQMGLVQNLSIYNPMTKHKARICSFNYLFMKQKSPTSKRHVEGRFANG